MARHSSSFGNESQSKAGMDKECGFTSIFDIPKPFARRKGYFIGCLVLKVGCYAIPILIYAFLCSKRLQDRKASNLEEHVFGTTLAMRQNKQAHFWLSSTNYEHQSLL